VSLEIEVSVPSPPTITVTVEPGGAQGPQGEQGETGPAGEIDPAELEAAIEDYLTENPPTSAATWGDITGTLADQTDLDAELAAKSDVGHTHAQSDVTGLTAALDGKADDAHTHTASDVTDFNTAADARVVAGITGKSDTGHTHTASNITDFNTAADARVVAGITGKADLASPALTGNPTAPTASPGDNDTSIATTAFVTAAIAAVEDLAIADGSANNPHVTQGATRNAALPKNFWQYTGTEGVDDPDNWIAGDEWISA
jgi:hypothetical protein